MEIFLLGLGIGLLFGIGWGFVLFALGSIYKKGFSDGLKSREVKQ